MTMRTHSIVFELIFRLVIVALLLLVITSYPFVRNDLAYVIVSRCTNAVVATMK